MALKGFKRRLEALEKQVKEHNDEYMMVFGVSDREWIADEQRYADERGVKFEEYSVDDSLQGYLKQAKDLNELRELADMHNFHLTVLPSTVSMDELWADEQLD